MGLHRLRLLLSLLLLMCFAEGVIARNEAIKMKHVPVTNENLDSNDINDAVCGNQDKEEKTKIREGEMSVSNPSRADGFCPEAAAIVPCVCTNYFNITINLDCTYVESEEQLASVFQQEFPLKELQEFFMANNSAVKILQNFTNGITFESVRFEPGPFVLEGISTDFLMSTKETLRNILIKNSEFTSMSFPFEILPSLDMLDELEIDDSSISSIPPIFAPHLTSLILINGLTDRIVAGTFAIHEGPKNIYLFYNAITTVEPGSFFFADDNATAGNETVRINLGTNPLAVLQAGTFPFRNGKMDFQFFKSQIASIEPGAFVLPQTTGNSSYEQLNLDLSYNQLASLQAGTIPVWGSKVFLDFSYNHISSIELETFVLPNASDGVGNEQDLFINLSNNMFTALEEGTLPLVMGPVEFILYANQIVTIAPGTFVLPETLGKPSTQQFFVNLSGNKITSLQAGTFPILAGPIEFVFFNNKIVDIEPGTFFMPEASAGAVSERMYIGVDHNQLQTLQAGTFPLRNGPTEIYLNNNRISNIEQGTFVLATSTLSLRLTLALGNNLLTTVNEEVFADLMIYTGELQLHDNPLTCNCSMAWLVVNPYYLAKVDLEATCADGTNLHDLDAQDFLDSC